MRFKVQLCFEDLVVVLCERRRDAPYSITVFYVGYIDPNGDLYGWQVQESPRWDGKRSDTQRDERV